MRIPHLAQMKSKQHSFELFIQFVKEQYVQNIHKKNAFSLLTSVGSHDNQP